MEKKRKAEDKRSRREERKALAEADAAEARENDARDSDGDVAEMTTFESSGNESVDADR